MRLNIFVTHPVQYHVPIWKSLANTSGLEVKVFYFSDISVRGYIDPGFGIKVAWDIPLLEGYEYHFISRDADIEKYRQLKISNIKELFEKHPSDFVLINGYMYSFERQIIRHAKEFNTRVILRGELTDNPRPSGSMIRKIGRDIYLKWFYKHVDKFCYVGEDAKKHLARMGIAPNRMFFSPYSVDDTLFIKQQKQLDRSECRLQLGISEDQFAFIFSGKMVPRKMPVFLAETILEIPEKYKIVLIILGDGIQKEMVENLLRPVLNNRLIMPGFVNQSQLGKYFMAADAFILPSNYDTWGLVVNEAMNFSLPVITSDAVGCRHDLVIPDSTGYIFQSGDIFSLKGAMLELLENPEKAREMGKKARQKISEYSISRSVEGILSAIYSF